MIDSPGKSGGCSPARDPSASCVLLCVVEQSRRSGGHLRRAGKVRKLVRDIQ
jgi:hypothetical protein